jgi:putative solute:sodium symporter small subunit
MRKVTFMAKNKVKNPDKAYWRAIIKMLFSILVVWAVSAFLLSIVFVEQLNQVYLGGYPLGFWFAQQGSIYIFIILIFVYVVIINKIDKKYNVHENKDEKEASE